jgi:hypothetical protein
MATQKAKEVAKDIVGTPLTPNFSSKDYSIFFAAGAICCTLSHGGMTRESPPSADAIRCARDTADTRAS